jgi:hypothetical protein
LENYSTKQIALFRARAAIPVRKICVYAGSPHLGNISDTDPIIGKNETDPTGSNKMEVYLQMDNTQKNGLGLALPAGRVCVYQKDDADAPQEYVGEDLIPHIPPDGHIRVHLGTATDVVGSHRQTDFQLGDSNHDVRESFEITLNNPKKEAVHVLVKETLYRWNQWEITAKSDDFEKVDARTIQFPVDVPADGQKKVTYSVKYTW